MNPAPTLDPTTLDATFFALADPTRRAILQRLARGEANVNELAEPFSMSQPAISKHLKVLEGAGLVSVRQEGRRRPRRLEPEPLEAATDWIERYRELWETNYRRLDALLEELKQVAPPDRSGATASETGRREALPRSAPPHEAPPDGADAPGSRGDGAEGSH
jgi:DNA-binding transcriptional ArsR family regulator